MLNNTNPILSTVTFTVRNFLEEYWRSKRLNTPVRSAYQWYILIIKGSVFIQTVFDTYTVVVSTKNRTPPPTGGGYVQAAETYAIPMGYLSVAAGSERTSRSISKKHVRQQHVGFA